MSIQWVACNLRTGRVVADLPSFVPDWPLRRSISQMDTATGTLYLDGAPPEWEQVVLEGGAALHCFDDEDPLRAIQWSGYVNILDPQIATDTATLTLTTFEAYLDRRYVPDVTYTTGRDAIVADMVARWVADGAEPGIPLAVSRAGNGPVPSSPLVWQNTDNATVLTRLNQLVGQLGGEFTIESQWSTDQQSITQVLYVGDRIGAVAPAGMSPAVTFELPGVVTDFAQPRDYSAGNGANKIVAYSSGQGDVTPYAPPVYASDFQGRPTFEYRYAPLQSEDDTTVLQSYSRQAMKILAPGNRAITVTVAHPTPGRRFGSDWHIGDDVGIVVDPLPALPGGLEQTVRVIAAEMSPTEVTPVLFQPQIYTDEGTS